MNHRETCESVENLNTSFYNLVDTWKIPDDADNVYVRTARMDNYIEYDDKDIPEFEILEYMVLIKRPLQSIADES